MFLFFSAKEEVRMKNGENGWRFREKRWENDFLGTGEENCGSLAVWFWLFAATHLKCVPSRVQLGGGRHREGSEFILTRVGVLPGNYDWGRKSKGDHVICARTRLWWLTTESIQSKEGRTLEEMRETRREKKVGTKNQRYQRHSWIERPYMIWH